METPLELTFNNMDPSPQAERRVREKVARLERIFGRITSCHVFIEAPHRHHRKGNQYEVRIEVRVPGTELAVNQKPGDVNAHEDLNVAIRDSFDAMERQLKHWKRSRRTQDVHYREAPLQGRISDLHPEDGYGQIAAVDGRLIYFHRNSVVDGRFEDLEPDAPVELVVQEDESEKGPQASTVRLIGEMEYNPERG